MNISRSQRVRLGIFLVIGLFLLLIFVVVPLGFKIKDTSHTFIAFFSGESLSGLEQGATVKFSGVPIGKVDKIGYLPNDLEHVRVEMKIQRDFPVKVDMVATTGAMGITGLKYIEITGGTDSAALLKPGSEITTRVSAFSTISGKAESIVAKIELLLNHLNEISDPDSLKGITEIIDNIAVITKDFRDFIGETRPDINEISGSVVTILNRVDSVAQDVKKITAGFNQSIKGDRIGSTLSHLDSATMAFQEVAENMSLLIKQSREDFSVTMQNIREASENADQLTKMLLENPSLLIRSETQKERSF